MIPRSKWQPATFVERGVTVPFTTPAVAFARLRPVVRGGSELIVANPSGAQGSYVFPLRALGEFTTLSMHDRLLLELLVDLPAITPATIRGVARRAAASGAAGPDAARSAAAAAAREAQAQLLTRLLLIARLLRQAGCGEIDWRRLDLGDRETLAATRRLLARHEAHLGLKPDVMLTLVDELSTHLAPIGLACDAFEAPHAVTIERLSRLAASLRGWAGDEALDQAEGIELIARCADVVRAKVLDAASRARAHTEDMVALLRAWRASDQALRRDLARPDWLLDGWGETAALWEAVAEAERDAQRVALGRIETLVPVLPKEADDDAAPGSSPQRRSSGHRWVRRNEDWRSGSAALDDGAKTAKTKGVAA